MQNNILVEISKYLPSGRCIKYILYLLRDGSGEEIYSLSAEFTGGEYCDRAFVEDISHDRGRAERFLYLIAFEEVEPCHLRDVVYDLLPL